MVKISIETLLKTGANAMHAQASEGDTIIFLDELVEVHSSGKVRVRKQANSNAGDMKHSWEDAHFTDTEYWIFKYMVETALKRPLEPISREEFIEIALNGRDIFNSAINPHISSIRSKIKNNAPDGNLETGIITSLGTGYFYDPSGKVSIPDGYAPKPVYKDGWLKVYPDRTFISGKKKGTFTRLEHAIFSAMAGKTNIVRNSFNLGPFVYSPTQLNAKVLRVRIYYIRQKIEPDPGNPVIIQSVWGKGYKLVPFGNVEINQYRSGNGNSNRR